MERKILVIGSIVLLLCAFLVSCGKARAEWREEYAQADPEVQSWYKNQHMTPEAQQRMKKGWTSCCEHGDVFRTQFRVVDDGSKYGHDAWFYLAPNGNWKQIPEDVIHFGEHAPDGRPTLFIYSNTGEELCFYPGKDGG